MAKLDEEFSTLAQTEALLSLSHPSKMKSLKALLNKDIKREHKEGSFGLPAKESNGKVCQHVAIFHILSLLCLTKDFFFNFMFAEILDFSLHSTSSLINTRKYKMIHLFQLQWFHQPYFSSQV